MMVEILALMVGTLLTALAVVCKTRAKTDLTVARPTFVGWVTIVLAAALLILSIRITIANKKSEDGLRRDLSRSIDQNLLLIVSSARSPRKIVIDIPLLIKSGFATPDVRDVIYPEWRHETTTYRWLGEWNLAFASAHVDTQLQFGVGTPDVLPISKFNNKIKDVMFGPEQERSCAAKQIWDAIPPTEREELERWWTEHQSRSVGGLEPSFGDSGVWDGRDVLEKALSPVVRRRGFLEDDCFSEALKNFRGPPIDQSMAFQDEVRLNRRVIREVLGIYVSENESFCRNAFLKIGGANENPDPSKDGLGPEFDVVTDCSLERVGKEKWILRFQLEFEGQHSLADWLPDFAMDRKVFEIVYFDHKQTALSVEAISQAWRETFASYPARVFLPLNESGSVGIRYDAKYSVGENSQGDLNMVWKVSSGYKIEVVARYSR